MKKYFLLVLILLLTAACSNEKDTGIEDDKLGFIDADVSEKNTNLKTRAQYNTRKPGDSQLLDRSFEHAPPMIPHTTAGFFPIKITSNICLSCHVPEKAKEVEAIPMPETHFIDLRKHLVAEGDIYKNPEENLEIKKLDQPNAAYFNCSQCHAPQADVTIDITNRFTPEFRKQFDLTKSNLNEKLDELIN